MAVGQNHQFENNRNSVCRNVTQSVPVCLFGVLVFVILDPGNLQRVQLRQQSDLLLFHTNAGLRCEWHAHRVTHRLPQRLCLCERYGWGAMRTGGLHRRQPGRLPGMQQVRHQPDIRLHRNQHLCPLPGNGYGPEFDGNLCRWLCLQHQRYPDMRPVIGRGKFWRP